MFLKVKKNFCSGISTIELMVTIGIFAFISTSVLISYPDLSSKLSLDKTTQEIASSLHETRMYGIGIRSFGAATGARTAGFGVHFDASTPNSYILFSETKTAVNEKYEAGEEVSTIQINGRENIKDVCVLESEDDGTAGECAVAGTSVKCFSTGMLTADIFFLRPAPSVFMRGYNGPVATLPHCPATGTCSNAVIIVGSPRGRCKKINIWTTGQVSTK